MHQAGVVGEDGDPVTVFTHDARLVHAARAHGLAVFDPLAA